ncbi:isoprenylcysteine carboxylmethyltransferase family protein [Amycolatopsis roodepoortensis]|uniref:methyltransferase family protein n=1 Tax=Amycolatopsis roodepoortensis TaxID=700274 RepID=UPI00214BD374|nr:isoprenylcysteine carboxylmethyltransferase family protein [Amycolatopsis roodepoortensis]UUV28685.1 isoprenylcysteine carboxylmethyltransferase family protein [Amycolatopsis roodepoortensis]
MAAIALGLSLLYLLAAFGLRTLQHYRSTGETGFRGVSGRPGSLEWWGGALFVVALLLGLLAPILQLIGVLAPIPVLDTLPPRIAGLVLAGAGIVGTLAAQHSMGTSWRIGVDRAEVTGLVTTGAFAFARNPIFTAMIATALGLALLAPNLVALAGVVCLITAIEIQVRAVEEPYLLISQGQEYRDYAARTGRFLPTLGRLRPGRTVG